MGTCRVPDDNTLAQPTVIDFDGEPIEFTLFVEPVGFDNCQATDVVLVEPGFEFDVAFSQPSCFANDGVISVEIFEDASAPEGPFTIELYEATAGVTPIETLVWDNINDFNRNDLVPGDYTVLCTTPSGASTIFPSCWRNRSHCCSTRLPTKSFAWEVWPPLRCLLTKIH